MIGIRQEINYAINNKQGNENIFLEKKLIYLIVFHIREYNNLCLDRY